MRLYRRTNENGENHFKGSEIKCLRQSEDSFVLELNNGDVFHIAVDARGRDAYVGFYKETPLLESAKQNPLANENQKK